MTRVAILGAAGRMGREIVRCAVGLESVRIVAAVERADHPALGEDAGLAAGAARLGVPIAAALPGFVTPDALVDFSFHAAVPANAQLAAGRGAALVVGTTGLTAEEQAALRAAAARIPVVVSPNMSLGVNLLFALVERAARTLGPDYDIEIVEMHHRLKRDAPSGTALGLAERAAAGRGIALSSMVCHGRSGHPGERPRDQIGIHAVRGGDVVGDHTVHFATDGERIELTHRATGRHAFARGALRAAAWAHGRAPGCYTMQDVLGL
jgi:4-hydroxy-tetrahydrodipicolinate reductase